MTRVGGHRKINLLDRFDCFLINGRLRGRWSKISSFNVLATGTWGGGADTAAAALLQASGNGASPSGLTPFRVGGAGRCVIPAGIRWTLRWKTEPSRPARRKDLTTSVPTALTRVFLGILGYPQFGIRFMELLTFSLEWAVIGRVHE